MLKPQRNKHAETHAEIKDRLTLTPRESVNLTRFGLNHTYELLRSGEMPAIRVGKRFFIPKSALLKWLESAGSTRLAG
jgi:excisionase family DNA binding protein